MATKKSSKRPARKSAAKKMSRTSVKVSKNEAIAQLTADHARVKKVFSSTTNWQRQMRGIVKGDCPRRANCSAQGADPAEQGYGLDLSAGHPGGGTYVLPLFFQQCREYRWQRNVPVAKRLLLPPGRLQIQVEAGRINKLRAGLRHAPRRVVPKGVRRERRRHGSMAWTATVPTCALRQPRIDLRQKWPAPMS